MLLTLYTDSSDGQHWLLEPDDMMEHHGYAFAGWMSRVPQATLLSQLSIPSTHQSIATNDQSIISNAVCQGRSVYEQLVDGVRAFDLRFGRWSTKGHADCLYAMHSFTQQIVSFAAVLQSFKLFLARFPGETVIIKPRNESNSEGFVAAFLEDFRLFADTDPSMFMIMDGKRRMCDTTIREAAGRVIVLIPRDGSNQLPPRPPNDWSQNGPQSQNHLKTCGIAWDDIEPYAKYWAEEDAFL